MVDDVRGAGAFHDLARLGALLWRLGPSKKCAFRAGAVPWDRRTGYYPLVGDRLLPRFFARMSLSRRTKICVSARRRCATKLRLFVLGFAECFRDVPIDVRHH